MAIVDSGRASHQVQIGTGPLGKSTGTPEQTGVLQTKLVQVMPKSQDPTPPPTTKSGEGVSLSDRVVEQQKPAPKLVRAAWTSGVSTKDDLIKTSGRPKDDRFFGLYKMSTGYKAVLGGLEDYHGTIKKADTSGETPRETVKSLMGQLDRVYDHAERYGAKAKHSHKGMVNEVQMQVEQDREVLAGLDKELASGGKIPPGMSFEQVLAFAREGISLNDMASVKDMTPLEARNHIEYQTIGKDIPDKTKTEYTEQGFRASEAVLLEKSGLGLFGGMKYRALDIPIIPETVSGKFAEATRTGKIEELGSGAFNSVYKAKFKQDGGTIFDGVFKPLAPNDTDRAHRPEHGWVAKQTGVNQYNPQIALRNLATCSVAHALKFDVVPHTEIGFADLGKGETLGLVMARAKGNPASKTSREVFDNPEVRREIVKLQLLDHLVGQGDRHSNNYFINVDKDTGKVTVTGIDNDQCFGKNLTDPNGIAYGYEDHNEGFRGTTLPPVIDSDMARAFETMTKEGLADSMKGLRPSEISAAQDRLQAMQDHIGELRTKGRVIDPDKWGDKDVMKRFDEDNSYLGRDRQDARRASPSQRQELDERQKIIQQNLAQIFI
ncbi:hypothetical protein [Prosthecodimorpha staleyi]|uniref:PI3K/PI4K catalytic domain-containing protein n=1 Tax=Prosthecodimorpha staleyi TaxID=2840188 RepID=A0A947D899_9HYPH|nr:hypothetical protein [Prosthecodimorpha staleyi]MBT9292935.1 hypothetical protein [Prosthecodimorpha staleyi]